MSGTPAPLARVRCGVATIQVHLWRLVVHTVEYARESVVNASIVTNRGLRFPSTVHSAGPSRRQAWQRLDIEIGPHAVLPASPSRAVVLQRDKYIDLTTPDSDPASIGGTRLISDPAKLKG
jgi:hypothetical protein